MRIGEVAARTAVGLQALRYYERRGLLPAPPRLRSGYREYGEQDVHRVLFIRRAKDLGFTLQEIGDLLRFWPDSAKSCGAVERRATVALARTRRKVSDLKRIQRALAHYVSACRNRRALAGCPLLSVLGAEKEE